MTHNCCCCCCCKLKAKKASKLVSFSLVFRLRHQLRHLFHLFASHANSNKAKVAHKANEVVESGQQSLKAQPASTTWEVDGQKHQQVSGLLLLLHSFMQANDWWASAHNLNQSNEQLQALALFLFTKFLCECVCVLTLEWRWWCCCCFCRRRCFWSARKEKVFAPFALFFCRQPLCLLFSCAFCFAQAAQTTPETSSSCVVGALTAAAAAAAQPSTTLLLLLPPRPIERPLFALRECVLYLRSLFEFVWMCVCVCVAGNVWASMDFWTLDEKSCCFYRSASKLFQICARFLRQRTQIFSLCVGSQAFLR